MARLVGLAAGQLVVVTADGDGVTVRPTTEAALMGAAVSMTGTGPAMSAAAAAGLDRVAHEARMMRHARKRTARARAAARGSRRAGRRRAVARRRGK